MDNRENKKKKPDAKSANKQGVEKALREIVNKAMEDGSPVLLVTQESENSTRCLVINEEASSPQIKLIRMMAKAGDLDSFFRAVLSDANEHGHDSAFLRAIGIAYDPIE